MPGPPTDQLLDHELTSAEELIIPVSRKTSFKSSFKFFASSQKTISACASARGSPFDESHRLLAAHHHSLQSTRTA